MKSIILFLLITITSCSELFYDFSGIPIKIIHTEEKYPDARKAAAILEEYGATVVLKETSGAGISNHIGKMYYTYTTNKSEETANKISNSISSIVTVTPEHSKDVVSAFSTNRSKFIIWIAK